MSTMLSRQEEEKGIINGFGYADQVKRRFQKDIMFKYLLQKNLKQLTLRINNKRQTVLQKWPEQMHKLLL